MILEISLLALAWMALTGDWSLPALGFSGVLAWLLVRFVRPMGGAGFRRVRLAKLPGLLVYLLKEIVVANLKVAAAVVAPAGRLRPAIVAVALPLDRDVEIALLAKAPSPTSSGVWTSTGAIDSRGNWRDTWT